MTSLAVHSNSLLGPSARARKLDTVSLLTAYLILLIAVPSNDIVGALGGAGVPANLMGVTFLIIYLFKMLDPGSNLHRGPLHLRLAATLLLCCVLASYVVANLHKENAAINVNGADRGLIILSGWLGILLLTADGIDTFARLMRLLDRLVLGVTCLAGIGLLQFIAGTNVASYISIPGLTLHRAYTDLEIRGAYSRPQATTAHPLEFAFVLVAVLPIAMHLARYAPRERRAMRWAQVALITLALPLTISRAAMIGLAIVALVVLSVWERRERFVALSVILLTSASVEIVIPGLVSEIGNLFLAIGSDSSTRSRTSAYTNTIPLIVQHPLFGIGFATFDPQVFFYTDNEYLNAAIEIGLAGVLSLLGLFLTGWSTARRIRRTSSDPEIRHLAQCLAASCAAIVLVFATFDTLYFSTAAGVTFLILGCVGALHRLHT